MMFLNQRNFGIFRIFSCVFLILNILTGLNAAATEVIRLQRKWIHTNSVTLSGHSSGAEMAHLLHVVHSKLFIGVGIFAGLYYLGKPEDLANSPSTTEAKHIMRKYEKAGLIDPLKNLKNQKVFIWGGTKDFKNLTLRVGTVVEIYAPYLGSPSNLFTKIQYSTHGPIPTGHCSPGQEPEGTYLGACHYNGILPSLEFSLGKLTKPNGQTKVQKLIEFDQREFFADFDGETSFADTGRLYIPSKCSGRGRRPRQCYLHLYFHGCGTRVPTESDIKNLGYLEIAEVNNIIVVFPQIKKTKMNPKYCWDIWGYTGKNYATKKGLQVQVIQRIIERISGL